MKQVNKMVIVLIGLLAFITEKGPQHSDTMSTQNSTIGLATIDTF